MSTHVIKRRAITTPSYRISSELRCFGFFFLSREWLCLGALYRDLGQKIPDLVKTAYKCTGRQSAVKFSKIREKCEKSDTEQGSASSLNARLFRADVEKGTILI